MSYLLIAIKTCSITIEYYQVLDTPEHCGCLTHRRYFLCFNCAFDVEKNPLWSSVLSRGEDSATPPYPCICFYNALPSLEEKTVSLAITPYQCLCFIESTNDVLQLNKVIYHRIRTKLQIQEGEKKKNKG